MDAAPRWRTSTQAAADGGRPSRCWPWPVRQASQPRSTAVVPVEAQQPLGPRSIWPSWRASTCRSASIAPFVMGVGFCIVMLGRITHGSPGRRPGLDAGGRDRLDPHRAAGTGRRRRASRRVADRGRAIRPVKLRLAALTWRWCWRVWPASQPRTGGVRRGTRLHAGRRDWRAFGRDALAGRVTLLDFVYTHCTDACPIAQRDVPEAQRKFADEKLLGSKVMLLCRSVSTRGTTTPSVLAEYGQPSRPTSASWKFLTGDWDQVYDV